MGSRGREGVLTAATRALQSIYSALRMSLEMPSAARLHPQECDGAAYELELVSHVLAIMIQTGYHSPQLPGARRARPSAIVRSEAEIPRENAAKVSRHTQPEAKYSTQTVWKYPPLSRGCVCPGWLVIGRGS